MPAHDPIEAAAFAVDSADRARQRALRYLNVFRLILGGLFLQFFPDVTAGLGKGLSALLYAVLLIAAMVAMPDGVAGALSRLAARIKLRRP